MKTIPHRHHAAGKRKIRQRLDKPVTAPSPEPVFTASNIHYQAAAKTQAISCGGIGALPLLVRKLGLAEAIDERLHLLKYHLPYHESDWAAPRYLVHSKWKYATTFSRMRTRSSEGLSTSFLLVTCRTELLRRRVPERAVRSDCVVLPAIP